MPTVHTEHSGQISDQNCVSCDKTEVSEDKAEKTVFEIGIERLSLPFYLSPSKAPNIGLSQNCTEQGLLYHA